MCSNVLNLSKGVSLKPFNTFGIDCFADYFSVINNEKNLLSTLIFCKDKGINKKLVLGGGSNILFTSKKYEGIILYNQFKEHEILSENDHEVLIQVNSGVVWNEFVLETVRQGWWGVENLTAIPGTVGAAPIQNIGAYGVEVKNCITQVKGINLKTLKTQTFSNEACKFGYRNSIFKQELKDDFFITSVCFKLSKIPQPNLSYKDLKLYFKDIYVKKITLKEISNAVEKIRSEKIPSPSVEGNSGSFFKNPILEKTHFLKLKEMHSDIPSYEVGNNKVKIPAAWMIEKLGWKGKQKSQVACHKKQALVIVNKGNATGEEIKKFSEDIQKSVFDAFGVALEREVNFF